MSLQTEYFAKKEEIAVKRTALAGLFAQANTETDPAKRDELATSIKTSNDELSALVDAIEPLQELVIAEKANAEAIKAMRGPGPRQVDPRDDEQVGRERSPQDEVLMAGHKSVGSMLLAALESHGLKSFHGFRGDLGDLAIKTLSTSADLTPLEDRQAAIQPPPQEERTVADLMLQGTTTAQVISYFQETTTTNAAAFVDEGAAKPESAIDFTLRQDNVRKIATWLPVTDEMLEDVPAFEAYLRGRLAFFVKSIEEFNLLQGPGTGITIQGLYNRTGVQTVTGIGMSTIDSILAAITEIQTDAFAEPTAMVIHPRDYFDLRTSKDTTGNYLLGPAVGPVDVRPWGLQVRVTTNALQNTALVGAFTPHAQVFRRSGLSIAISTENEDYFIKNKVAVRAEERLALAVYRPSAFCKVEGFVQGS